MLCSRGGRNIERHESESLVTKDLLSFEKNPASPETKSSVAALLQ